MVQAGQDVASAKGKFIMDRLTPKVGAVRTALVVGGGFWPIDYCSPGCFSLSCADISSAPA
jgi:hypothetical protein